MEHYTHLIVGGGMTAHAALLGIHEVERGAEVGMIGAEAHPPYNRPPLSKALWKGKSLDTIWRKMEGEAVRLHPNRRVTRLDLEARKVVDDQGTEYGYDNLLLATGGTPRKLPSAGEDVIYFRTLDDYQQLRTLAGQKQHFGVVGGGFIGSEIAAALSLNGRTVTMIFPEETLGRRQFPADLSRFVSDYYDKRGIRLMPGRHVQGVERAGDRYRIRVVQAGGGAEEQVEVDVVVAGLGITPNVELAQAAGLPIENGIAVDRELRAGRPEVFAAGDAASFQNPSLNKRIRVEHEDNANSMGDRAGRNMAGEVKPYDHLPFFYSDLFELGYEAVGELDSSLETVAVWAEPLQKGVIYYLRGERVRGVLLWDVWGQVEAARKLIAEPGPHRAVALQGRIPIA